MPLIIGLQDMKMKTCTTCGNEIGSQASVCPYCDGAQTGPERVERKAAIRISVVKLKDDNPTVEEAMQRLEGELATARKKSIKVIKVIHGYGSTGTGGSIKTALLIRLRKLKEESHIKTFVTGEAHNAFAGSRNYLLNKYPELKETWVGDRGNPGITFIEL